jgi:hypothetical protein
MALQEEFMTEASLPMRLDTEGVTQIDVKESGEEFIDDYDELDMPEEYPLLPWCDSSNDEFGSRWVDYDDRGPRDVVISGPVTGGWGPGRWHTNRRIAYWRCVGKYGVDRVKQLRQSEGRWSFLIKNLKAV